MASFPIIQSFLKLPRNRRKHASPYDVRVKNVVISKRRDTLSQRALVAWVSEVLDTVGTTFDDLRTGAIYCQLLHSLYPRCIMLSKVRMLTTLPSDFEINFRLLSTAFNKLQINRDIPVAHLMKGPGNYEFCNWFHQFYIANHDGNPYNAKQMRHNSPIGLQRSQSIIGFDAQRSLEDRAITFRMRRNVSFPRIQSRTVQCTKPVEEPLPRICKQPEDFCRESKLIDLPPSTDSENESAKEDVQRPSKIPSVQVTPIKISGDKYIEKPKVWSAPSIIMPSPFNCEGVDTFKEQEMQILRLRKLYRAAAEKLDAIKGILLEHHHDPNYSLVHITEIIFDIETKENDTKPRKPHLSTELL